LFFYELTEPFMEKVQADLTERRQDEEAND
jgi:hypothetical protein